MIPKKIHYCWFGRSKKPKLAEKCIESWKKYCPDYELIEWNEDNIDLNESTYIKYCYDNKKWAYLSDYIRLSVVEKYGGIYFDTDVELVKSIDDMLKFEAFFGFEADDYVASGLGFGAVAHHRVIQLMLEEYLLLGKQIEETREFVGCPILNTKALIKCGLLRNGEYQEVQGAHIFPADYFNPYDDATGRLNITSNTVSIHWYTKSALSKKTRFRSMLTRPIHRVFGVDCFKKLKSVLAMRKKAK